MRERIEPVGIPSVYGGEDVKIQMDSSQSNSCCIIIALITYAQVKHAGLTCIRGRADAVYQCVRRTLFCADSNCPEGCEREGRDLPGLGYGSETGIWRPAKGRTGTAGTPRSPPTHHTS